MRYIDFHTHHQHTDGRIAIIDGVHTWGIHPWNANNEYIDIPDLSDVLAIGECGLDRLCSAPYELQKTVFLKQIQLSEQNGKPLIIHCVRALDDLLAIHRQMQPTQPWIHHGFRGKPQQLQSLLTAGMFVSFGFRYNLESLLACPIDRLLIESDEEQQPIALLYEQIAQQRQITPETLLSQMHSNMNLLHL